MSGNDELGTLERDADGGDRGTIRFTRRYAHSIDEVWRAITEPAHQAAWFPARIDGERVAGAPLTFTFEHLDQPPMSGTMLAFDPPHLMELSWEGDVLRFELRADGDATVLEMSDTFEGIGRAARDGTGWHVCLESLLADLAGGSPVGEERWRELHPDYVERFGADAAVIGPPSEGTGLDGVGHGV